MDEACGSSADPSDQDLAECESLLPLPCHDDLCRADRFCDPRYLNFIPTNTQCNSTNNIDEYMMTMLLGGSTSHSSIESS